MASVVVINQNDTNKNNTTNDKTLNGLEEFVSGKGADTNDKEYDSIEDMWKAELADGTWYTKAEDWYINNCPTTVDGVLGGFGKLDPLDVAESCTFLIQLFKLTGHQLKTGKCLDCGAGIGRVTKNLLSKFFLTSDLLESNQRLINEALNFVDHNVRGKLICNTLQDFIPNENEYDCIWIQWVVIYLTDDDFVLFLKRCVKSLKPNGFIVIKENVMSPNAVHNFLVDKDDSSVTRSDNIMRNIFHKAGLKIVKVEKQKNFPSNMFPVLSYALKPVEEDNEVKTF
tara:strand:- start:244 stop:1095 length:852 start_codon:yes stop_codon:yes gene_type:complete